MELPGLTYRGAALDDIDILDRLPMDLQQLLAQRNGFVAFRGGLHVRGACVEPRWHSLRAAMEGPESFAERYRVVKAGDVPFAQSVFGDQFILRGTSVHRLDGYADTLDPVADDLTGFFFKVQEDPIGMLALGHLAQYEGTGETLRPGELLMEWPPFVVEGSEKGVSLRRIPAAERLEFLADIAKQLRGVADGTKVEFKIEG
jgi:hypothetical protein